MPVAPTTLHVGVVASEVVSDAVYVAVVRDPGTAEARLVRRDLREPAATELDRAPAGDGAVQLWADRSGIAWGFGIGTSRPGALRVVRDGVATAVSFGTHAPAKLLYLGRTSLADDALVFASTRDCALEWIDVPTGEIHTQHPLSCFAAIGSVMRAEKLVWIRSDDDDTQSIRRLNPGACCSLDIVVENLVSTVGPYLQPLAK